MITGDSFHSFHSFLLSCCYFGFLFNCANWKCTISWYFFNYLILKSAVRIQVIQKPMNLELAKKWVNLKMINVLERGSVFFFFDGSPRSYFVSVNNFEERPLQRSVKIKLQSNSQPRNFISSFFYLALAIKIWTPNSDL